MINLCGFKPLTSWLIDNEHTPQERGLGARLSLELLHGVGRPALHLLNQRQDPFPPALAGMWAGRWSLEKAKRIWLRAQIKLWL